MSGADGYDVIVVGLGGMGSAAAYHLAARGVRVLGLDANPPGHDRGSSHGRSRIIREAYYQAPQYVPLVQHAYGLWRDLETTSGKSLLQITGGLTIGRPAERLVAGALASARQHVLPYEYLNPDQIAARFPGFRLSDELMAVYEPRAGLLDPEACVAAHLDLATQQGADLHFAEAVMEWRVEGEGVCVETSQRTYAADRLVLTVGPWAEEFLAEIGLPLTVQRVVNVHFEPREPERFAVGRCPIHLWLVPEGQFYGTPALPGQGVKLGRHDDGEPCTPHTIRRDVGPEEVALLRQVLDTYMPGAAGPVKWSLTCMYTNTPDHHFVIDRHPDYERVVYACGFSGHGFKFSCAIGEVLADLATNRIPQHEIQFLSAARFSFAASATSVKSC
jgi:sarcosine oxidase